MRLLWLPGVLRAAGCSVWEMPGWQGRGRDMTRLLGLVGHDTVTPSRTWTVSRVDALLRNGRPGVPGPLSQTGMDWNGTWRIIAAGRSNHNGYGYWGNDSIGCEVYCGGGLPGDIEPWNAAQRASFVRGSAAILRHLRMNPADHLRGHKETDPRRKIDPYGVDMNVIRDQVRRALAGAPPPPLPPSEDPMTPAQMSELKSHIDSTVNRAVAATATRVANQGLAVRTKDDIADRVFAQIAAKGLSVRTKDDIAKRVIDQLRDEGFIPADEE
jgi:hypothetical protein